MIWFHIYIYFSSQYDPLLWLLKQQKMFLSVIIHNQPQQFGCLCLHTYIQIWRPPEKHTKKINAYQEKEKTVKNRYDFQLGTQALGCRAYRVSGFTSGLELFRNTPFSFSTDWLDDKTTWYSSIHSFPPSTDQPSIHPISGVQRLHCSTKALHNEKGFRVW